MKRFPKKWLFILLPALLMALAIVGIVTVHNAYASGGTGASSIPTPGTTPAFSGVGGPRGEKGHGPGGVLTVTAINGQTITAKQANGSTITIKTTSSTVYTRAGQKVSASDIKTGENIHVRGTRNSDSSISATNIDIVLPGSGGMISAIKGDTITVKDPRGNTHTIKVTSSTSFLNGQQKITLSSLKVGENIHAVGTLNSDGSLTATTVSLGGPRPAHGPGGPGGTPCDGKGHKGSATGTPSTPSTTPTSGSNA